MNYLDIALIIPLVYGLIQGFSRGIVREITSLVSLVIGVYIAINFSFYLESYLEDIISENKNLIPTISFAAVFAGTLITHQDSWKSFRKDNKRLSSRNY